MMNVIVRRSLWKGYKRREQHNILILTFKIYETFFKAFHNYNFKTYTVISPVSFVSRKRIRDKELRVFDEQRLTWPVEVDKEVKGLRLVWVLGNTTG